MLPQQMELEIGEFAINLFSAVHLIVPGILEEHLYHLSEDFRLASIFGARLGA